MSTAIASSQYDPNTQTLVVSFVKGGSFTYTNVPQALADGLRDAGSQGKYFNQVIRPMDPGGKGTTWKSRALLRRFRR
jgi:hypothetical protein